MFGLGIQEVLVLGVVAVLLFGKRLPEVARSLGTSYRDFRRGLNDIQSQMDIRESIYHSPTDYSSAGPSASVDPDETEDAEQPTAPKFELPSPTTADSESSDESRA